jgi:hypothetical protein
MLLKLVGLLGSYIVIGISCPASGVSHVVKAYVS